MNHLKLFEEFQEGPMEKPKGFFSKLAKSIKHAAGFEKKEDRESIDLLHNILDMKISPDFVKNVREIKPGVIVAWVNNYSITVDKNVPEILYKGNSLDLHNIEDEVEHLYNRLLRFINK